ncbi:MAG TPA: methylated-DNA--[protein]-cysteine S-methyltransferase [Terriglobales bacterium]|nr:methylated-DNA--[protein]-cysteine S-methyltransferase [Terriglobales bacterium]
MDEVDDLLAEHFAAGQAPAGLTRRLARVRPPRDLAADLARFHIEAGDEGVRRLTYGTGGDESTRAGRRHVTRAREELAEYLAGLRTFFSVPVDLTGIGDFQSKVLAEAARIPYGSTASYADLARRIGHAKASRAVGNALGANPIPILVPCHRIIRGDGSWGHYAFGAPMKTKLLTLERSTPLLVGCSTTRIVCRRGCSHEQRMRESSRVVFASIPDARSVGYRPCKACHPRERGL